MQMEIFSKFEAMIEKAVTYFIDLANVSIQSHDAFFVALSGGNTPKPLYRALAAPQNQTRIAWDRVHLFWGDERNVPADHPESNYKMVKENLIDQVPIPPKNVHRVSTELDFWEAAEHYERKMRRVFSGDWPEFDLILLGMGDDGHTASLFPYSSGVNEEKRWFIANFAPRKDSWRLTLTKNAINSARNIIVLVQGHNKASMLRDVFAGTYDPISKPIQLISPINGEMIWLLDRAAGQELPSESKS